MLEQGRTGCRSIGVAAGRCSRSSSCRARRPGAIARAAGMEILRWEGRLPCRQRSHARRQRGVQQRPTPKLAGGRRQGRSCLRSQRREGAGACAGVAGIASEFPLLDWHCPALHWVGGTLRLILYCVLCSAKVDSTGEAWMWRLSRLKRTTNSPANLPKSRSVGWRDLQFVLLPAPVVGLFVKVKFARALLQLFATSGRTRRESLDHQPHSASIAGNFSHPTEAAPPRQLLVNCSNVVLHCRLHASITSIGASAQPVLPILGLSAPNCELKWQTFKRWRARTASKRRKSTSKMPLSISMSSTFRSVALLTPANAQAYTHWHGRLAASAPSGIATHASTHDRETLFPCVLLAILLERSPAVCDHLTSPQLKPFTPPS